MQTDFSPLKKSLPARSHEFLPRKCATLVFLALERVEFFSQDLYPEQLLASPGGQLHDITVSIFSIKPGQIPPRSGTRSRK